MRGLWCGKKSCITPTFLVNPRCLALTFSFLVWLFALLRRASALLYLYVYFSPVIKAPRVMVWSRTWTNRFWISSISTLTGRGTGRNTSNCSCFYTGRWNIWLAYPPTKSFLGSSLFIPSLPGVVTFWAYRVQCKAEVQASWTEGNGGMLTLTSYYYSRVPTPVVQKQ